MFLAMCVDINVQAFYVLSSPRVKIVLYFDHTQGTGFTTDSIVLDARKVQRQVSI
jgi:hypothetical protein